MGKSKRSRRWRPMKDAPKDGREILLLGSLWRFSVYGEDDPTIAAVCHYDKDAKRGERWRVSHTVYYDIVCLKPIAWMPIPKI